MLEQVVLVDENDSQLGVATKDDAHRGDGALHRAISVFVFEPGGRLLLQRRAATKHHFRGLWANTCCSHPRPGEDVAAAGRRRLRREMGIDAELDVVGAFAYRAEDPETGLVEHEYDHVLVGTFAGDPAPDPREADNWAWVDLDELRRDLERRAARYAPWLPAAFAAVPELWLGAAGPGS